MSRNELTQEIEKLLESTPDAVLLDVLALLRQRQTNQDNSFRFTENLDRILEEDHELLKKLAQ